LGFRFVNGNGTLLLYEVWNYIISGLCYGFTIGVFITYVQCREINDLV